MALEDEIKQVCDNWAVLLSTDLLASLNKALKEGGSTNPNISALQFNPVVTVTNTGYTVRVLSNYDYWYWVEYGRKKGKMPPSEVFGKKWQNKHGINANKVIAEINLKTKKGLTRKPKKLNYEKNVKTLSYLIARSVGKKGYKARPFIDRVVTQERINDLSEQLAKVMSKNITIDLTIGK